MTGADSLGHLRVVDFSQGVAGPMCGTALAQHGADVVKIEPPAGDWGRRLGRPVGDMSAYACVYNLGKRSIALDLKSEQGLAVAKRLCQSADVVIENFRPEAMPRLGLGYEALSRDNPGLVYLSISGFGREGPGAHLRATDTVMQAFSGFVSINRGNDGEPHKSDMTVVDVATGLFASQRLLVALLAREKSGRGTHLHVSLMHAMSAFMAANLILHHQSGGRSERLLVPAGTFPTADGHLSITTLSDGDFARLCRAVEEPALASDARYQAAAGRVAHADELHERFRDIFRRRTTAQWCAALEENDVLVAPVHDFDDLLAHPQFRHEGVVDFVPQDGVGPLPQVVLPGMRRDEVPDARLQAPHCGQHSRAVLADLGYDGAEIEALLSTGVAAEPAEPATAEPATAEAVGGARPEGS